MESLGPVFAQFGWTPIGIQAGLSIFLAIKAVHKLMPLRVYRSLDPISIQERSSPQHICHYPECADGGLWI